MADLFSKPKLDKLFKWTDVKTWFVRTQYNELLNQVLEKDVNFITDGIVEPYLTRSGDVPPNYYNPNLSFALVRGRCNAGIHIDAVANATGEGQAEGDKKTKSTGKPVESGAPMMASSSVICTEGDNPGLFRLPAFLYDRAGKTINVNTPPNPPASINSTLRLESQLNFASVLWLYNYERMGIFEILKALMNDYNYAGKLPISAKAENTTTDITLQYSGLMDAVSTLYRLGIGSNTMDRRSLYQRVLGITLSGENGSTAASEKNVGFMRNFNKLIGLMIDFYRDKQLAQAIRDTNTNSIRSSVATQTSIRDTILVLQKNIEAFEYGRNRINTFLAISTVFATICLLRMLKDEIGVPRQYNEPHEFIPAAYDILVAKRPVTSSENNRFTIYDNCASYGFRLLTDIEFIEPTTLTTIAIGSTLDAWLNDIEGVVEGYNNAYKSIADMKPEKEMAMA